MKITTVMINTKNPGRLAEFWKSLLGVDEDYKVGNFLWLKAMNGSPAIGFQKVEDKKDTNQSVHIDILVDNKQLVTEKVQELGGSLIQEGSINNIVADPEGNRFCVYVRGDEK